MRPRSNWITGWGLSTSDFEEYISGVILYHETLVDFRLASVLEARGIIPGVRADTDSHPLPISPLEPATQGLDDLLPRLRDARVHGARFSKVGHLFIIVPGFGGH